MGPLTVIALRLLVPLTILRWPLWGGLAAIVADACDILILQQFGFSGVDYQRIDKPLDIYYLTFEAIVAQRWAPLLRWTATALFVWRIIGFALFEATGARRPSATNSGQIRFAGDSVVSRTIARLHAERRVRRRRRSGKAGWFMRGA